VHLVALLAPDALDLVQQLGDLLLHPVLRLLGALLGEGLGAVAS